MGVVMIFSQRKKRERDQGIAEARRALSTSVDDLHATVMRGEQVRAVASKLRSIQQDNHFAEAIRHVYGSR